MVSFNTVVWEKWLSDAKTRLLRLCMGWKCVKGAPVSPSVVTLLTQVHADHVSPGATLHIVVVCYLIYKFILPLGMLPKRAPGISQHIFTPRECIKSLFAALATRLNVLSGQVKATCDGGQQMVPARICCCQHELPFGGFYCMSSQRVRGLGGSVEQEIFCPSKWEYQEMEP